MFELLYKGIENLLFPETVIVNCSGYFYDKHRNITNKDKAIETIMNLNEFVIKPNIGGSAGDRVQIINLTFKNEVEKRNSAKNSRRLC